MPLQLFFWSCEHACPKHVDERSIHGQRLVRIFARPELALVSRKERCQLLVVHWHRLLELKALLSGYFGHPQVVDSHLISSLGDVNATAKALHQPGGPKKLTNQIPVPRVS